MFPLEDIASGARLLHGLPVFLRQRIGPEQARRVLRERLEEVLPARFGGGPTDYQLLEGT
jgi:hypothetical protein